MQSIIKNAGCAGFIVAMLVCASVVAGAHAEMTLNAKQPVELTKVDLFSLLDWKQREVTVDGFFLGMTRDQVFEVARTNKLRLRSDRPPRMAWQAKLPCREKSCSVLQVNGNWIGINLFFEEDRLVKMKVSVPVDAAPEVKQANIARKFKGRTYQFFNGYSDDLRVRLFGSAEGAETPVKAGAKVSTLTYIAYEYLHSGVIVHVTIDKKEHPSKPFDLEVDFVNHQ